jgi:uracil-DNA glycosylase
MLNTCLTVKAGSPGSHSNRGWEIFTDKVVAIVDKWGGANLPTAGTNSAAKVGVGRGVVFMAWGSWAQKRVSGLNRVSQTLNFFTITLNLSGVMMLAVLRFI